MLIGATIAALLFLIPLPYIVIAPGSAVDLDSAVSVPGHAPPPGKVYLTDVTMLDGRPIFYAAAKFLPGFELIPTARFGKKPPSYRELNRQFEDLMHSSQLAAQAVAERAAGLPVRVHTVVTVAAITPHTPAERCFKRGDRVESIDGKRVTSTADMQLVTRARTAGSRFGLALSRSGKRLTIRCATAKLQGVPRFGIYLDVAVQRIDVPVHVSYKLPHINGSSAGLMFALQIYRSLKGLPTDGDRAVAGTGVIDVDGRVTAIEGARQKLRAAVKAGATTFLVPKDNYNEVRGTPGVRIIPVATFKEALAVLGPASVASPGGAGV